MDDRRFLIEIQRQGKILSPMRLCSGKMWKSNVKNIFSYNFPLWPVGVKSYRVVLKTRQQNDPKLEILQTAIRYMFDYWYFIIVAHMKKKKKKKIRRNKNYVTYRKMIILI